MSLRVSGGRRLQSPPGTKARPTAARVRLAVINRLAGRLSGCRWLDLCCGSGAMACEALHHGAAVVVGVEQDRRIATVARANLTAVAAGRLPSPDVQVVAAEVLRWLSAPAGNPLYGGAGQGPDAAFDLIYVDPPYAAGIYGAIAQAVRQGGWLRPHGVMVWECSSRMVPETPPGWRLESCRRYGSSTALYLEPLAGNAEATGERENPPGGSATQG
ncbi:MAG: RsmD family RNA methyltransferase, partial [Cyanobium sp.]